MTTPALTSSTRFTDQSVTKVYFLPAVTATNLTPTRTEMNNGTDLSGELNDISGWTVDAELIDTQNINTPFRTFMPGVLFAPPSSLTFYTSKTGTDVRSVLTPGTTGYIMFVDGGDVVGHRAEVYPVTIASIGVLRTIPSTTGSAGSSSSGTQQDASKVKVAFAITGNPSQSVTVPA